MTVTIEISLYPLQDAYEEVIIDFIGHLKASEGVTVHTHAMSTFLKGDMGACFHAIKKALENTTRHGASTVSCVMKVVNRDLPVEAGFLKF